MTCCSCFGPRRRHDVTKNPKLIKGFSDHNSRPDQPSPSSGLALPYFRSLNIRRIADPRLAIQGDPYLEEAVRRAVQLAYMCLRDQAKARPTIREIVEALEVLVEYIARKKVEGSPVNEEDGGLERRRDVADAKRWAKDFRDEQRKSKTVPKRTRF
ncbi:hypothetical protein DY000_02025383 [Brassica cretica]|uniref:Protein kinase domain-containing protein n=1 Tax=Brassica cretica TaxID=69181 RepID=A0ABQ7EAD1_BRACR|nr:hypothetical protein DY000_02025383 [Brassica cretica]